MHITNYAKLGLMLFTLTIWPTLARPLFALEWCSRWPLCKVVKHSFGLLISEMPITSHSNLVFLSSSSSYCMFSSVSRVLML